MGRSVLLEKVEIEIGDNLFLEVKDVLFNPGTDGYISGLPEDCYEATDPEIEWTGSEDTVSIIHRETIYKTRSNPNDPLIKLGDKEKSYKVSAYFANHYYEELLTEAEEQYKNTMEANIE